MSSVRSRASLAEIYEAAAQDYLRSLPPEHFMESIGQSTQRKITLESLDLLRVRRPDVQVFSEMLVQYPLRGRRRPAGVVPDNMVVMSEHPSQAKSSFDLSLELAKPFWVLEYVSRTNRRKDYEDNFERYEQHLQVPYYLVFDPEVQHLALFRHTGKKYVAVKMNKHGRYAISALDVEVALLDGWVRFWHLGELLPLPADLQRALEESQREAAQATRRADELQRRLEEAERELARYREQGPPAGRRNHGPKPEK